MLQKHHGVLQKASGEDGVGLFVGSSREVAKSSESRDQEFTVSGIVFDESDEDRDSAAFDENFRVVVGASIGNVRQSPHRIDKNMRPELQLLAVLEDGDQGIKERADSLLRWLRLTVAEIAHCPGKIRQQAFVGWIVQVLHPVNVRYDIRIKASNG